ncbi:MAG: FG-GAP-like repeat-containing protein [Flavobacteriales bacterium]|tara:strand:+ start:388 stop:2544 length:2157 start_codon:yes stop_codon:yes gene_type:complete
MRHILIVFTFLSVCFQTLAQQAFYQSQDIEIIKNGFNLVNPWAGGANVPQLSAIDLNKDGILDLIIFDKNGDQINCFINNGAQGEVDYHYAPEYNILFPELEDWVLLRDYNCDGKMDIFTSGNGAILLYENLATSEALSFQLVETILTDRGSGPTNLYVSSVDIPHIGDLDFDGDLDILTFSIIGSHVEWHKNNSIEKFGSCDSLDFTLEDDCWGDFSENFSDNSVTLNDCAKKTETNPKEAKHSGSTVTALDLNNDSYFELLLGDVTFDNLVMLENSAPTENAFMVSQDVNFPDYNTSISLTKFPAAYYLDLNNDQQKDLIITPNGNNVSHNYENIWFYENTSSTDEVHLNLVQKNVLLDEMIEVGSGAHPVFFDYNKDGLMDLIVANYGYYITGGNFNSQLALYENVGTLTEPLFEWITDDYAGLGLLNFDNNIIPTFGDIDNDGDQDMLLGDSNGKIHLMKNIEINGEANFFMNSVNYLDIDVGSFASPFFIDLDRDGDLDLIIGSRQGQIFHYENQGDANEANLVLANDTLGNINLTDPIYNTAYTTPTIIDTDNGYELFVGTEKGHLYHYNTIDDNLDGSFELATDSMQLYSKSIKTAPALFDLNNDGWSDLLIGLYTGGVHLLWGGNLNEFSTDELKSQALTIYPNPSKGTFNISSKKLVSSIGVYSLNGTEILRNYHRSTFNLTEFPTGLYFVKVIFEDSTIQYSKVSLLK